jgi:CDP-glucose 4,6-dehydratase
MSAAPVPTFWHARKVLVTGATGLVGSHLVDALLDRDANVTVLLRDHDARSELFSGGAISRVGVVSGSLEDLSTVERAVAESEASVVFHLGAQTIVGVGIRAPILTFESNVRGTYNVLEACRRQSATAERIVIASSDKAYGQSDRPYREDDPLRPSAPYDASKAAADLIAHSYFKTYQLPLAILRCGNTYGGGDLNWSRIIPSTIRSFLRGEAPEIRSDGTLVRDYIYVADVVAAYIAVAEALDRPDVQGEAFNFASGSSLSVLEIVKQIAALMGGKQPEPRILNVAKNEIGAQRLSTEKARKVLSWAPRTSLHEGLRETIAWYRGYLAAVRSDSRR